MIAHLVVLLVIVAALAIAWLVLLWCDRQFREGAKVPRRCECCGNVGPTTCLPYLGARRFCLHCARRIMA